MVIVPRPAPRRDHLLRGLGWKCPCSVTVVLLFLLTMAFPASAAAQSAATPQVTPLNLRVQVSIVCEACDAAALRVALPFVDVVPTADAADVTVLVTSTDTTIGREWRVAIDGRARFADRRRTIAFSLPASAAQGEVRANLTRLIKLGIAEFAADAGELSRLEVKFTRPAGTVAPPHDRWNHWVFRLGAYSYGSGQQSTFDNYYSLSGSANRTTEAWKVRMSAERGTNRSSFTIDESETIKTRLSDWSSDVLVVRSLGARLSAGLSATMNGSTYSNTERVARVTSAVEYDLFPYTESSKRSLTIQYNLGTAHYEYAELTIFERLSETVAQHAVGASLGLQQPWGSVGGEFQFTQQLTATDRTRASVYGNFSVRLLKSLSLNGSGSYSRIRDQFTLVKGAASEDEVLLRQRQLATGFRYSMSFGISYSFGALSNATVNPRFSN